MGIFKRETAELERTEAELEAEVEMEGQIREVVRREVEAPPRQPENDGTLVADNIGSLVQRVSASSVQEIDALINELQILRERLHDDGKRVHREIVQYASLSQAAMQSTRAITESLGPWKNRAPGASGSDEGT